MKFKVKKVTYLKAEFPGYGCQKWGGRGGLSPWCLLCLLCAWGNGAEVQRNACESERNNICARKHQYGGCVPPQQGKQGCLLWWGGLFGEGVGVIFNGLVNTQHLRRKGGTGEVGGEGGKGLWLQRRMRDLGRNGVTLC